MNYTFRNFKPSLNPRHFMDPLEGSVSVYLAEAQKVDACTTVQHQHYSENVTYENILIPTPNV